MCTYSLKLPFLSSSIEMASSKSLASSPSIVIVRRSRRSLLPFLISSSTREGSGFTGRGSTSDSTSSGNVCASPNCLKTVSIRTSLLPKSPRTSLMVPLRCPFSPSGFKISHTTTISNGAPFRLLFAISTIPKSVSLKEGSGTTTPPSFVCLNMPMTWFFTASGPLGATSEGQEGFSLTACIFAIISRLLRLAFWLMFFAYENLLSLLSVINDLHCFP